MKNLKDHTPNSDSWEKILQQGQFESQLVNHLKNLPQFSPNEEAWQRITAEMDRKKTIPIWVKWSVAASILGFLLVGGISISRMDSNLENHLTQVLPNQNSNGSEEIGSQDSITLEPTQALPNVVSSQITSTENHTLKSQINRNQEIIEVPKISLPELHLSATEKLSLHLPEPQKAEPIQPKTLHEVTISWNKIKPGLHVKTPFGRKEMDSANKTQASTNTTSQITLEINN